MFIKRKLTPAQLIQWLKRPILWLLLINTILAFSYFFKIIDFSIPWLPVSVIGTAVAFFVGFKNNQAYERMWEARKIWGGIVNDSRTWGMMVDSFIRQPFNQTNQDDTTAIKKKLVYRHIAWLYAHRDQLLEPLEWEQTGTGGRTRKQAKIYTQQFGLGLVDNVTKKDLYKFLDEKEFERMKGYKNMATQLVNEQSRDLIELYEMGYINDFRHMEMEEVLRSFYTLQGKNERIKKFPFPRDYSSMSQIFVWIFIVLLPFSLIPELIDHGTWTFLFSIPVATTIGLIYIIMEDIGDYTENPFMSTPNAIPMLSLCRVIEIDLREMLGETNLPPNIEPSNGALM